jgi:hypothetical protein
MVVTALLLLTSVAWAAEGLMLDRIDLGTGGTEEGRTMDGWGRSATDETGGSYGSISPGTCRLVWDGAEDDPDACILLEPGKGAVKSLEVRHLDGIAVDSFDLYVEQASGDWLLVGSYADQYSAETWVETVFDLEPYGFGRGGSEIRLKIDATGDKWSGFDTYGQLCIDWIEVYGNGKPPGSLMFGP